MDDACYLCRRTQVDLDRLNEEIRTRVYLSYFTNIRGQIDDERRKVVFLQRLKDEEGGDPHFRINAKQVFGDPKAYQKLMPWIDTLIEIVSTDNWQLDETRTIGELVNELLQDQHRRASKLEEGLERIRAAFAPGGKFPFYLETLVLPLPVGWSLEGSAPSWRPNQPGDREPLLRPAGDAKPVVEVPIHVCSVCRRLARAP
ncbi:MAG TPA: hypothetical protein VEH28_01105 [Thermoplasmata archaeon]|nr:hypothetical protein [Thermoplasmata archaeon]